MSQPARTDLVAGRAEILAAMVSHYRCSHCNGEAVNLATDGTGVMHARIEHDDTCPVLHGHVSALPDTFRAAANTR
ncbi:hypothetical protein [Streptomyces candidus]|uniref:Uncharacterized protein n=1 Tax=Streptomyces candidus TaxID=67283 RepID=A0A7X0LQM2_9ACTN|nr:hypothetical protein [Streptomyces candidus]MBB6437205.1 hypothetical protein [Streptomyces candidus]GHH38208.1 hypothetical protein GCM10018773_15820 [Streptomyces candidus]